MRGEPQRPTSDDGTTYISTHSPRAGRTFAIGFCRALRRYFNSLAPCGANHRATTNRSQIQPISTHSPRAGRTLCNIASRRVRPNFNSLAPCGANPALISHSPTQWHFNSLAPCGANLISRARRRHRRRFQLTRPVRGEPLPQTKSWIVWDISTHSPRAGRTGANVGALIRVNHFNSLAPCGANLFFGKLFCECVHFNSLAPCGANRRAAAA